MQVNLLRLLFIAAPAMAMLRGTGDLTLMTDMRPDVVRKLLSNVEQKWIHTRAMVLSNVTDMEEAYTEMEKSCIKVSSAIIQGSEGQKDRVNEYMQDVCTIDSAHEQYNLCSGFASGIGAAMTDDSEYNRDSLQLSGFCRKFWDTAVTNAAQAEAKQRAEEEEKERVAKEEAEKKAEKEAAALAAEKEAQEKKELQREHAEKEEAEKKAAAKAAEEAEEAAKANVNQSSAASSQANETAIPVEAAQANSTATQPSGNVEQTNGISETPVTPANSTTDSTPAEAAAPEQKTNSTEVAKAAAAKNATA